MNEYDIQGGLRRISNIATTVKNYPDRKLSERMYWIEQIRHIAHSLCSNSYSESKQRQLDANYIKGKKREKHRYVMEQKKVGGVSPTERYRAIGSYAKND